MGGRFAVAAVVAVTLQLAVIPPADAGTSYLGAFRTEGHLKQAAGLATDNLGNVYVADGAANRIVKFDKDGNALLAFGQGSYETQGTRGHLWLPADVTVANGLVYVADAADHVNVFTTGGDSVTQWAGVEDLNGPLAITSDCAGNLYVADARNNRIVVFDPNGTRIRTFGPGDIAVPSGIAIDQTFDGATCVVGKIYVSDEYSHNIVEFAGNGEKLRTIGGPGQGPMQFGGPEHLALDKEPGSPNLTLWVAEAGNMRAQRLVSSDFGLNWSYGGEIKNGAEPIGDTHALTLTPEGHLLVGNALGTIYEYAQKAPSLTFDLISQRSAIRDSGRLRYQVKYNQSEKTCDVLVTARIAVPHHAFSLEERVVNVGSDRHEFARLDMTKKQLGFLKKVWKDGGKVAVSATAKGSCSDNVHVRKHADSKI
jgi:sugar lactone lactonase YvrE